VIKLSDYVAGFLADRGVRDVFLVAGGGVMHLLDSIGREERIRYICTRHEQACAVAAEGYACHQPTRGLPCHHRAGSRERGVRDSRRMDGLHSPRCPLGTGTTRPRR